MENLREIVNGAQLPRYTNRKVSITGFVTESASNGMSFDIRAVDNTIVKINLKRPLDRAVEGYVEVHGTSLGKHVMADEYIIFSNQDFDAQGHNSLCTLLYSVPNIWDVETA